MPNGHPISKCILTCKDDFNFYNYLWNCYLGTQISMKILQIVANFYIAYFYWKK